MSLNRGVSQHKRSDTTTATRWTRSTADEEICLYDACSSLLLNPNSPSSCGVPRVGGVVETSIHSGYFGACRGEPTVVMYAVSTYLTRMCWQVQLEKSHVEHEAENFFPKGDNDHAFNSIHCSDKNSQNMTHPQTKITTKTPAKNIPISLAPVQTKLSCTKVVARMYSLAISTVCEVMISRVTNTKGDGNSGKV